MLVLKKKEESTCPNLAPIYPNTVFKKSCASSTPKLEEQSVCNQRAGGGILNKNIQSGSIGRNSPEKSRTKTGEESLESSSSVQRTDRTANSRPTRVTLQSRLDRIDREDGDPHGNTSTTTGGYNRRNRKFTGSIPVLIGRRQHSLNVLVRGKVGSGTGTITGQSHGAASKHATDSTFLIQLPHDVQTARVLGLLAGRRRVLALDLQKDLDPLKGSCYQGHGNGGEEPSRRDLGYGELRGPIFHGDGRCGADNRFAQIIALLLATRQTPVLCHVDLFAQPTQKLTATESTLADEKNCRERNGLLTHRRHPHQWSRDTSIQALRMLSIQQHTIVQVTLACIHLC